MSSTMTEQDIRLAHLHHCQRSLNMEPRSDSRLTQLYVDGALEGSWTAPQVARELMATDYIFKHTLYGEVIEVFLRKVAKRLRNMYPGLSWSATWTIVQFYGPIALKLMCLTSACTRIPERMPPLPQDDDGGEREA